MESILKTGLAAMEIPAEARQIDLLARYGRTVLERNQVMNLTAVREPEAFARRNILDSAALLRCFEPGAGTLIDVGTGAGFPGMVLKILRPDLRLTLLDATGKKVAFLRETAAALGLHDVRCVQGRGEELGRDPAFREQFDFAAARAVAAMALLAELTLPFLRVGGQLLAMKAEDCEAETAAALPLLRKLGGEPLPAFTYTLPEDDAVRRVIRAEKRAPTPALYPRTWAKMKKEAQG
ncbi:MAG: 16S rRNA (guanine(527)-N(7))-methyltransferase RsmG [Oscillospiraceae bacterium]|nr:16S rRNA (guanine(527)-N(7))-methyltransferase RsmG [Oscillospiraceae bacterium]